VGTRRTDFEGLIGTFFAALPSVDDVKVSEHQVKAEYGHQVPMRLFVKTGTKPGPLVVFLHGGGMIMGSVALYEPMLRFLASESEVAVLAPDYRLAPEHPHPTPVEDCYAALRWAAQSAAELGVDPARIAVAGDSAGGGLAAAVALIARDRGGPMLARQVLIYPMLDDRNTVAPELIPEPLIWSYDDNLTGWSALLGDRAGSDDVSPYAAPARATILAGLPHAVADGLHAGEFSSRTAVLTQGLHRSCHWCSSSSPCPTSTDR
jgi:acetyl esterase/lipase